MPSRPIERFVKKQIADQGGWPRILERIASGETVADVSRTLMRPDGIAISRCFLSRLLHADPERSTLVKAAKTECAAAMVDDALHIVDSSPIDRDAIQHGRTRAELRLKVAGLVDRESWGERKQNVEVTVNVATLHLDALRHRQISSRETVETEMVSAVALPIATVDNVSPARGTDENGSQLATA